MILHLHAQPGAPEWPLIWEHLRRAYQGTDLKDTSESGESWEYMGTYFSEKYTTHDNNGRPMLPSERTPVWTHQFRHRDYRGDGRVYVNIVADAESLPGGDPAKASDNNGAEIPF